jgi:hypothetical protein
MFKLAWLKSGRLWVDVAVCGLMAIVWLPLPTFTGVNETNFRKIQKGMAEQEVHALMDSNYSPISPKGEASWGLWFNTGNGSDASILVYFDRSRRVVYAEFEPAAPIWLRPFSVFWR